MSEKLKLYRMFVDFGRMGDLEGLFISTEKNLKTYVGKRLDFGECLGKHSDVSFEFEMDQVEALAVDSKTCRVLLDAIGCYDISGYSPFNAMITCDECGYEEEDCECEENIDD